MKNLSSEIAAVVIPPMVIPPVTPADEARNIRIYGANAWLNKARMQDVHGSDKIAAGMRQAGLHMVAEARRLAAVKGGAQ